MLTLLVTNIFLDFQDVFEMKYAKMPEEQLTQAFRYDSESDEDMSSAVEAEPDSPAETNDESEEEREKKLKELQGQVSSLLLLVADACKFSQGSTLRVVCSSNPTCFVLWTSWVDNLVVQF